MWLGPRPHPGTGGTATKPVLCLLCFPVHTRVSTLSPSPLSVQGCHVPKAASVRTLIKHMLLLRTLTPPQPSVGGRLLSGEDLCLGGMKPASLGTKGSVTEPPRAPSVVPWFPLPGGPRGAHPAALTPRAAAPLWKGPPVHPAWL